MIRNGRLIVAAAALAPLLGAAASADDGAAPAVAPLADGSAPPVAAPPVAPTSDAPAPPSTDLLSEVDRLVGEPVHGDLTTKYRARWTKQETDQDLYEYLTLRVGDEQKDRWSGNLFARVVGDLDAAHSQNGGGHVFDSLNDTFDSRVNALLYTAYATIRPENGPVESARVGRQYVLAAETFHVDGASVTTRPLVDSIKLQVTGYAGIPVHFYEASPDGDWLAGVRFTAAPWTGGRVAAEYTHDQDRLSVLSEGTAVNDLAALSAWQTIGKHVDAYGQFTWLDGPRDGTLRLSWALPDQDFLVQASYYRLLETKKQFATEFDPYYSVINELSRYQQAEIHASKGIGEHFDVDVGGSVRHLLSGEHESAFNRDTSRVYVTPSVTDLPWTGFSASLTGETLNGASGRITTWAADLTQKFGKKTKVSVGSDYSLYAFGPLGGDERNRVRTAYARVKTQLTKSLSADVQYTWENDDVESFHVIQVALVLTF